MNEFAICESRYSFEETVDTLVKAIEGGGGTVFAKIDQADAARATGLSLRPTMLLVFGNPKAGTPLMDAFPLVALDLPLKLLVWQECERVSVAFVPIATIAARYGVAGKDAVIAGLSASIEGLLARVK